MHTVWSDASGTILVMAEAAIKLGYQYIAITDHTKGLKVAGGLDEDRLEQQGWVGSEWKDTELGRNAKFYFLTREGKRQLTRELESWHRLSSAVGLLLKNA